MPDRRAILLALAAPFLFASADFAAKADADPFAAAEHRITHRREQPFGDFVLGVENGFELSVDSAAVVIEALCECERCGPCYHRGPS